MVPHSLLDCEGVGDAARVRVIASVMASAVVVMAAVLVATCTRVCVHVRTWRRRALLRFQVSCVPGRVYVGLHVGLHL